MSVRVTGEALAPFLKLLQDFETYSKNKDVKGMMSRFVSDDDIISFGRLGNKYEKPELKAHIENYFNHNEGDKPEYKKVVVYQYGEAACLCAVIDGKKKNRPDVRISLYLENHEGQWLIRHRHHSVSPD